MSSGLLLEACCDLLYRPSFMDTDSLKELLIQITDRSGDFDSEGFVETLKTLDAYFEEHKDSLSPKMKHYLENRGYTKALAHLEDPKNTC